DRLADVKRRAWEQLSVWHRFVGDGEEEVLPELQACSLCLAGSGSTNSKNRSTNSKNSNSNNDNNSNSNKNKNSNTSNSNNNDNNNHNNDNSSNSNSNSPFQHPPTTTNNNNSNSNTRKALKERRTVAELGLTDGAELLLLDMAPSPKSSKSPKVEPQGEQRQEEELQQQEQEPTSQAERRAALLRTEQNCSEHPSSAPIALLVAFSDGCEVNVNARASDTVEAVRRQAHAQLEVWCRFTSAAAAGGEELPALDSCRLYYDNQNINNNNNNNSNNNNNYSNNNSNNSNDSGDGQNLPLDERMSLQFACGLDDSGLAGGGDLRLFLRRGLPEESVP
ncbi:unnamed protein product, partial [Polarella glacialis]